MEKILLSQSDETPRTPQANKANDLQAQPKMNNKTPLISEIELCQMSGLSRAAVQDRCRKHEIPFKLFVHPHGYGVRYYPEYDAIAAVLKFERHACVTCPHCCSAPARGVDSVYCPHCNFTVALKPKSKISAETQWNNAVRRVDLEKLKNKTTTIRTKEEWKAHEQELAKQERDQTIRGMREDPVFQEELRERAACQRLGFDRVSCPSYHCMPCHFYYLTDIFDE